MVYIKEGKGAPRDETYAAIVGLPDIITRKTRQSAVLSKAQYTSQAVEWAAIVRGMARFETDEDDEENDGQDEGGAGRLTDPRVQLSMKAFEDLQQAGEDVEDQDIAVDDEDNEEGFDSSGQEDDGEEELEDDAEEQEEEEDV